MKLRQSFLLLLVLLPAFLLPETALFAQPAAAPSTPPTPGEYLQRIAFPIGGIGAGMFCLEGTGAISHLSIRNTPDFYNEPPVFAAIVVKGQAKNRPGAGRPRAGLEKIWLAASGAWRCRPDLGPGPVSKGGLYGTLSLRPGQLNRSENPRRRDHHRLESFYSHRCG